MNKQLLQTADIHYQYEARLSALNCILLLFFSRGGTIEMADNEIIHEYTLTVPRKPAMEIAQ